MRKIRIFYFAAFLLLAAASASVAEVIHDYKVDIFMSKDGALSVKETIVYDFGSDYKHGIFRFIPVSRQVGDRYANLDIKPVSIKRDGKEEKYSESFESGNVKYKIGKADVTMNGPHTYSIEYMVRNGIVNYEDHDELYWNALGDMWPVAIEKAIVTVYPPHGVKMLKSTAYTGAYGDKGTNYEKSPSGLSFRGIRQFDPYNGMSVVLSFPPKTFPPTIWEDHAAGDIPPWVWALLGILFFAGSPLFNILLTIWIIMWFRKNKKEQKFGKPFANFDIPKAPDGKRISPAEAGTIDLTSMDKNDVIGTIYDLAIRKIIKIEEVEEKSSFLGFDTSKTDYKLTRLPQPADELLLEHEQNLATRLFRNGEEVKLSSLQSDFYSTFENMESSLFRILVRKGFFKENPKEQRGIMIVLGIFLMVLSLLLPGITLIVLAFRVTGRTPAGDEMDFRIDGLKLFLSKMSHNYQWQAEQLAIVEKMIPYAMSLGYGEKFMEQLKVIKPDYSPGWYSGRGNFYLMNSALYSSMNSNLTQYAPSSSSGFGGGGFSGGGGGGGGGGSW